MAVDMTAQAATPVTALEIAVVAIQAAAAI
jgi:hypothetical protein